MTLSIGAFSRLSGLSVKALRFYDAVGLLRPAKVDSATGYRRYRPGQIVEAHRILALRQMGMAIGRIRGTGDIGDMGYMGKAELRALKREIEAQVAMLTAQLAAVEAALDARAAPVVAVKRVAAARVVALRRPLGSYDEAEALLDRLDGGAGAPVRGAVWHDCGAQSGRIEAELFHLGTARVEGVELPALVAASCVHGPGEAASQAAYRGLYAWLARSGRTQAGPIRELYYRVDGEHDVTEVLLPLARG